MPLPEGVFLDKAVHPRRSWPTTDPESLVHPGGGRGSSPPARIAADRTRWCAYGDHTLDANSQRRICDSCKAFRDAWRHGPLADEFTALPTVLVDAFVTAARQHAANAARLRVLVDRLEEPTTEDIAATHRSATYLHSVADLMREYLDR